MPPQTERRCHRRRSSNDVTTAPGWRGVVERSGERVVFYTVCLMLVFAPLALGALQPWACAILGLMTLVTLLAWAARVAVAGKLAWVRTPLDWPLAAGAAYVVARYAFSPVEWLSREEMLRVLMYAAVYFIVTQHFFRRERQNVLLWVLVATAAGITAYGFANWIRGVQLVWWFPFDDPLQRLRGTFYNPNHFAGYLDLVLAVTLAHLLWSGRGAAQRIVLAYAACVMLGGVALAGSRGGYITTGVVLVFVVSAVVRGATRRWWPVLAVLALGLAAGVAGAFSVESLRERFFNPELNSGGLEASRFWMWQAAWSIFLDHPWFGAGPALYNAFYGRYRDPVDQSIPEYAHNDYLQALSDYGIVGFGLMALVTVVFLVSARRIHRRWTQRGTAEPSGWHWPHWLETDRASRSAWLLGGVAAVMACLLHSAVDFHLHFGAYALTLTVILAMAMLAGHARRLAEDLPEGTTPLPAVVQPVDLGIAARRVLAALLLIFVAANAAVTLPNAASCLWHWLAKTRHDKARLADARAAAERAWAWDSHNPRVALLLGDITLDEARVAPNNADAVAEHALIWYRRAETLDPIEAEPVSRQARALEFLKRWNEAEAAHLRAHAISPGYFLYYERLGMFHAARGEKEKAVAELQTRNKLKWTPPDRWKFIEGRIKLLTTPPPPRR
jgi:O-antigen ligase